MTRTQHYAVPHGSKVLVTGANGYIASHIISVLLELGYAVTGTVRTPMSWLSDYFAAQWGPNRCELVLVPDFQQPDAFAESVQGVSGIIYVVGFHLVFRKLLLSLEIRHRPFLPALS